MKEEKRCVKAFNVVSLIINKTSPLCQECGFVQEYYNDTMHSHENDSINYLSIFNELIKDLIVLILRNYLKNGLKMIKIYSMTL
jgi:hypothetical protein